MRLNKLLVVWVIFLTALLVCPISPIAVSSAAADTAAEDGDSEEIEEADNGEGPSLSNTVQVERAERIAAASAEQPDKDIEKAQADVEKAEAALAGANESGDPDAITRAEQDFGDAKIALDGALANAAGVTAAEVIAMRESGMGWGQICHAVGVNPSANGRGNGKNGKVKEIKDATERNQKRKTKKHAKIGETAITAKDQKDSSSSASATTPAVTTTDQPNDTVPTMSSCQRPRSHQARFKPMASTGSRAGSVFTQVENSFFTSATAANLISRSELGSALLSSQGFGTTIRPFLRAQFSRVTIFARIPFRLVLDLPARSRISAISEGRRVSTCRSSYPFRHAFRAVRYPTYETLRSLSEGSLTRALQRTR